MGKNSKVDKIYIHSGDKINGVDVAIIRCSVPYIYPAYNDKNRTFHLYKNVKQGSLDRIQVLFNDHGGFIAKVHLSPKMTSITGHAF